MRIWFYRRRSRWQSVTGLEKIRYIMPGGGNSGRAAAHGTAGAALLGGRDGENGKNGGDGTAVGTAMASLCTEQLLLILLMGYI
jgi:hypothetical protein